MKRVSSRDGTKIAYDEQGQGPALILVNGAMTLIAVAGGAASLYGHSSGASLALEAAVALGQKVKGLAMYEAPYNDDPEAGRAWGEYIEQLTDALAAGRHGDAIALFMGYVGVPGAQIAGMRQAPDRAHTESRHTARSAWHPGRPDP